MVCRSGAAKCRILIFLYPGSYHALQATQGQRLWFVGVSLYCSTQCATFMYACLCHFKERMIVATFRVSKNVLYWQLLEKRKEKENSNRRKKNIILSFGFCEQGGRCFLLWRCQDVCHPDFIHLLCYLFFVCVGVCVFVHTHMYTLSSTCQGMYLEVLLVRCRDACWRGTQVRLRNLQLFVCKKKAAS